MLDGAAADVVGPPAVTETPPTPGTVTPKPLPPLELPALAEGRAEAEAELAVAGDEAEDP